MDRKARNRIYTFLQWTWGLPQTLVGAGLYLKHRRDPHFDYNGARVTAWKRNSGVSLGKFVFVPEKRGWSSIQDSHKAETSADDNIKPHHMDEPADQEKTTSRTAGENNVSCFLLKHEYGHTIQSLILGPFYLLLVGIPSMAWNRLPFFEQHRKKTGKSYYSAVFERTANSLGEKTHKQ